VSRDTITLRGVHAMAFIRAVEAEGQRRDRARTRHNGAVMARNLAAAYRPEGVPE
jgi:hypothetical protein